MTLVLILLLVVVGELFKLDNFRNVVNIAKDAPPATIPAPLLSGWQLVAVAFGSILLACVAIIAVYRRREGHPIERVGPSYGAEHSNAPRIQTDALAYRVDTEVRTTSWDVFISHASEDKEAVAKPLANELAARGLSVWLDANELKLGDSLSQKIDAGLACSRFGVVILSEAFFKKQWPARELSGLVARQICGQKVILPIWHGVDGACVLRHSPPLADCLAINSDAGISTMATAIAHAVSRAASLSSVRSESPPVSKG